MGTMCGCESPAATREVDDAHAAAAELALERVLAGERGLQVEELVGGILHRFADDTYSAVSGASDTPSGRKSGRARPPVSS